MTRYFLLAKMSVQLVLVEIAIWMFVYQTLAFVASGWVSIPIITCLISWRFGSRQLRELFSLKRIISVPVMLLLGSASLTGAFNSMTVSPTTTLIIPLQEELLYRFILPKVFERRVGSGLVSSVFSSVMFAFAHRQMFDFISTDMAVCLLVALALGVRTSYRNKKSIVESFVIHALHNMHAKNEGAASKNLAATVSPFLFYGWMLSWDVFTLVR